MTRNPEWAAAGAERVDSIREALVLLADEEHVYVIGGAGIYAAALPYADEFAITEVDLAVDGDTHFPAWERRAYDLVAREEHVADDGTRFAFTTYRRWGAGSAGQLSALGEVTAQLDREQIAYWLFGGWGVDFHAGRITRLHDDVDLASGSTMFHASWSFSSGAVGPMRPSRTRTVAPATSATAFASS